MSTTPEPVGPFDRQNVAAPAIYTPERLRNAARDHAAYGWTRRHGWNADGSAWTDEQRAIYDAEYIAAHERERANR